MRRTLEKEGVTVLEKLGGAPSSSESRPQIGEPSHRDLYLVGIGCVYARAADPQAALAIVSKNAPRIILMHNPEPFRVPVNTAPLALAGHTHGGQISIPFTKNWSWMALLAKRDAHANGWIADSGQAGNRLYVNCRIGFSSMPGRINCRPEITLFTLQ